MSNALQRLQETFGFDTFRPGQERVIDALLAGRSAAAVFPTGGGKSICYQLPALELEGLTLVVSPLIALMKDQIQALHKRGVAAARLDSSLSIDEYREVLDGLRGGRLKLLYVAPERFNNERFRETLKRLHVSLFAVDEAHCISEWGHNFRPDYLKLAGFAELCGAERLLALTATATPQVLTDICKGFKIEPENAVRTGFYRPNLTLRLTPADPEERDEMLVLLLQERPPGPTIVYVTLQRTAEEVAALLEAEDFKAHAYHAGMETVDRNRVQDIFMAGDDVVIVATIAFGMGIDKNNIRYVYHYNLPKSLENLAQEIGRAGRDGEPSICESLVSRQDVFVLQNFAYGDTPDREAILHLLREIFGADEEVVEISTTSLAARHDIRPLVLRTLLTQLELKGFLEAGTARYATYRFKPKMSSKEILETFSGERREFIRSILRQSKKAKTWFSIDLETAAVHLRQPRDRLVRALDYLGEKEMLEVEASGVRHPFRILKRTEDLDALTDELFAHALEREAREVGRVEQVLELATHDGCQNARLSEHFGESLDAPCGHCTFCLEGEMAAEIPEVEPLEIPDELWRQTLKIRAAEKEALGPPRAFSRFLVGLTSPRASRKRLSSHPLFGCLAQVPFQAVLERAEALDSVAAAET